VKTVCLMAALLVGAAAAAENAPKEAADLDRILRGAVPGMALADFLKDRPQAYNADPAKTNEPVNPEADAISVEEQFDRDPFLGLWCLANFGFKEGRLYEYTVMWYDVATRADARLETLAGACLRRHGGAYRREVMRADPGGRYERRAPVLLWESGGHRVLLARIGEKDPAKADKVALTYALLPKDDPFVQEHLITTTLTSTEISAVYKEMDESLKKILGRPGWDQGAPPPDAP